MRLPVMRGAIRGRGRLLIRVMVRVLIWVLRLGLRPDLAGLQMLFLSLVVKPLSDLGLENSPRTCGWGKQAY